MFAKTNNIIPTIDRTSLKRIINIIDCNMLNRKDFNDYIINDTYTYDEVVDIIYKLSNDDVNIVSKLSVQTIKDELVKKYSDNTANYIISNFNNKNYVTMQEASDIIDNLIDIEIDHPDHQ